LATELVEESLEQDDDENIEVALFTKEEIMEMIEKGKIKDSKTLLAIFWYLNCQK
jgi:ADP-ribose pyrophosphatase